MHSPPEGAHYRPLRNTSDNNIKVKDFTVKGVSSLIGKVIYRMCPFRNERDVVTCALLAGVGEVVVARNVVPLAVLMPDHHYAVLARGEEAVGLVRPPVFILLE